MSTVTGSAARSEPTIAGPKQSSPPTSPAWCWCPPAEWPICRRSTTSGHRPRHGDPGSPAEVYVDIATPAVWDGAILRSIDLDLDVIRRRDGTVYLDDKDEFAAHQVAYGYPIEVIELAEQAAAEVLTAVRRRDAPFDGTSDHWLAELNRVDPNKLRDGL